MEEEPSVLDYLKSKLNPWSGKKISIPEVQLPEPDGQPPEGNGHRPEETAPEPGAQPEVRYGVPWQVFLGLLLALVAQSQLEPPDPFPAAGIILYLLAGTAIIWAVIRQREMVSAAPSEPEGELSLEVRGVPFLISAGLMVLAFVAFGGNQFTPVNAILWALLIAYFLWAWWMPRPGSRPLRERLRGLVRRDAWNLRISRWTLLVLAVFLLAAFYRFYRLSQVPGEMFSDQAEKLWDVNDLLHGQTKIFFERNTGREFFQFYLTAAVSFLFGTGISFMSLKIGTALAGLFTLPFIYKLGKEVGGRWVGLFALFLAGVAYWPNVIARIGLRFPLYPLFAAPALYYLVRGLRQKNRNDLILAGLAVGLGLHGYSPFRIMPFVIAAGVAIYALHQQTRDRRTRAWWGLVVLGLAAFVIFLPLFRYALVENPDLVNSRALSRLSSAERELPGSPFQILVGNTLTALGMFFWKNGDIWVHSVVNRPALDVVAAALFFIGLIVVIARYARRRNWVDLFLLVSIPLLMLPSILSLAFPEENPSLNRTGAAYIPIFIIAAIGLESLLSSVWARVTSHQGRVAVAVFTVALLGCSASLNYDLVFRQFDEQFMSGAWNTSQIGAVIRGFAESTGDADHAYVIPYPYWVDTRLVGINAGYPLKDYALAVDQIQSTVSIDAPKLFIVNPSDQEAQEKLAQLYPQARSFLYDSGRDGKDFLIYSTP